MSDDGSRNPLSVGLRHGWLDKQGPRVNHHATPFFWKRRWFVLDHDRLHTYKSPQDTAPHGTLLFTDTTSVVVATDDDNVRRHCLKLVTPSRTWFLCAQSEEDFRDWLVAVTTMWQLYHPPSVVGDVRLALSPTERDTAKTLTSSASRLAMFAANTAAQYPLRTAEDGVDELLRAATKLASGVVDVVVQLFMPKSLPDYKDELLDTLETLYQTHDTFMGIVDAHADLPRDVQLELFSTGQTVVRSSDPFCEAVDPASEFQTWSVPESFPATLATLPPFVASRIPFFVGNKVNMEALYAHVASSNTTHVPLVIHGRQGSGKSAVLAQFYHDYLTQQDDAHMVLFVGWSPSRPSLVLQLVHLMTTVKERLGLQLTVPIKSRQVLRVFPTFLKSLEHLSQRFVMIFDSLDALAEDTSTFRELRWFPAQLPDNVRVIMSTHSASHMIHTAGIRRWSVLKLPNLHPEQRRALIAFYEIHPSGPQPRLSQTQLETIQMPSHLSRNPLYLRSLLTDTRRVLSLSTISSSEADNVIAGYLRSSSPTDLYARILAQLDSVLSRQYAQGTDLDGATMLRECLCALFLCRTSVSDDWLWKFVTFSERRNSAQDAQLAGADQAVPTTGIWSYVIDLVSSAFSEGWTGSLPSAPTPEARSFARARLSLSNRSLRDAVQQRYLSDQEVRAAAHQRIAQLLQRSNEGPQDAASAEIAFHLAEAEAWAKLIDFITRPEVFVNVLWTPEHAAETTSHAQKLAANGVKVVRILLQNVVQLQREKHHLTLPFLQAVAALLEDMDELEEAQKVHTQAIAYAEERRTCGECVEHITEADNLRGAASVLAKLGHGTEAAAYYQRALQLYLCDLPQTDPKIILCHESVASVYEDDSLLDEALEHYQNALDSLSAVHGDDSLPAAESLQRLAEVRVKLQQSDQALAEYEKAFGILKSQLGAKHPDVGCTLTGMALAYKEKGDYGKALEHYELALAIFEQSVPESVAMTLISMALLHDDMGNRDAAHICTEKAMTLLSDAEDSPELMMLAMLRGRLSMEKS